MVVSKYKFRFNSIFDPVGRVLAATGLTPNVLTLAGLGLSFAACAYLVVTKNLLVFSILIFLCGVFDGLDGAVARVSGKMTKFGAYLDAMCDRYFEAAVALAVAYVTGYWVLSALAIIGVMGTSYAKARAAMEVPVSNLEWPDFMEKGERDVIYVVGLFVSQFVHRTFWGHDLFYWVLLFLVIAVHFTVIQRILRARKFILAREKNSTS